MRSSTNENISFREFEIAIIGGGPAGSAAAIYLSQAGFHVALFEMKTFPREVLCGEFISYEVCEVLSELNLMEEFLSNKPNIINEVSIVSYPGKKFKSPLNFAGYGLKRGAFDNLLFKKAKDTGVCVFQPVKVTEIQKENKYFTIKYLFNGEMYFTTSCKVIAAYGKQNYLDKKFKRSFTSDKSHFNGIKFHITGNINKDLIRDEIKIFFYGNFYCGVNMVNDNTVTVCLLEDHSGKAMSSKELFNTLIYNSKDFSDIFYNKQETKLDFLPVYGCGNIFFGKRKILENGIYYIGDAARVIAPLAGDGIAMAVLSGKLICKVLTAQKNRHMTDIKTEKLYIKNWNRLFKKRIIIALIIQKIILNKHFRTISFYFLTLFPSALKYLIKSTRGT